MNPMNDTGLCAPESHATLLRQQIQLKAGSRDVQMFPLGTSELPLPRGVIRYENHRGVFHYAPEKITPQKIDELSSSGRENEFLNLGPFSKPEIACRMASGEAFTAITEYAPDGTEIRCAGGTVETADEQRAYFERTKEPGSIIVIGVPPLRVRERLAEAS